MTRNGFSVLCFVGTMLSAEAASAVSSAEFYRSMPSTYGRFAARLRFAAGDGVVSSFFLWKNGSEVSGTFWNELDFEKLGADCHLETNAIFGKPPANHVQRNTVSDPCSEYHTYAYEWTPEAIVWLIDGVEVRREAGATATAFAENAAGGMQFRFNVWPGDASFGGNFSPSILPVHQYVDWIEYHAYADGTFTPAWREDFDTNTLPSGWLTANWGSPKNLSTHNPANVNIVDGHLVLSLTADDARGPAGAMPTASSGSGGTGGPSSGGATGAGGSTGGAPAGSEGGDDDSEPPSEGGGCRLGVGRGSVSGVLVGALLCGIVLRARRRRLAGRYMEMSGGGP